MTHCCAHSACDSRLKFWNERAGKGGKRRTIGLRFNAAQAIGEYVEKAGITSGPLFRAQAAPRSREKLSNRPMDSATMYRVIQG